MLILIMGVCGAGKSVIGRELSRTLNATFIEGDDFHSDAHKLKMQQGQPLSDADRQAWLTRLVTEIGLATQGGASVVLACSALKQAYRDQLLLAAPEHRVIWLHAPRDLIAARLAARSGHFMHPGLLDSQLAILEPPADALSIDVEAAPDAIVGEIIRLLRKL